MPDEERSLCQLKDRTGSVRGEVALTEDERKGFNHLLSSFHYMTVESKLDEHDAGTKPQFFITGLKMISPLAAVGPRENNVCSPTRLLGKTDIGGIPFWVDCIELQRRCFPGDNGGMPVYHPYDDGCGEIVAVDMEVGEHILGDAYHAFGLDGEVNVVKIRDRFYCVFIYPSTK